MKYLVLINLLQMMILLLLKIKYLMLVISSKKIDYDAEIKCVKDKHFTTFHYNKFMNYTLITKINTKKLVNLI